MTENKKEWFCYEDTSGIPLYDLEEIRKGNRKELKDVKIGDKVAAAGFAGFYEVEIVSLQPEAKTGMAETEDAFYPLEFNEEKNCWTCNISIHKKCLEKIKVR